MARKRKADDDSSNSDSEEQQETCSSSTSPSSSSNIQTIPQPTTTTEAITEELISNYLDGKIPTNKATSTWGQPCVDIKNRKEKVENASHGYCRVCDAQVKGGLHAMKNHLLSCPKLTSEWTEDVNEAKDVSVGFMIYPAHDKWNRYWLFIEQSFASKLKYLDSVIRNIWVECCGHVSVLEAPDRYSYTNTEAMLDTMDEGGSLFSQTPVYKAVSPSCVGTKFGYKYDFGSPTDLVVEVIYVKRCNLTKNGRILARNNSFTHKCKTCKKKATKISEEDYEFYCDDHIDDEDSSLPICNSPRMGVCGFEGDLDDYIPESAKKKTKSPAKKKKK